MDDGCPIQGRLLALSGAFRSDHNYLLVRRKDPLKLRLNGAPEFYPGHPPSIVTPFGPAGVEFKAVDGCPIQGRLLALSGAFCSDHNYLLVRRKDPLKPRLNGAPESYPGHPPKFPLATSARTPAAHAPIATAVTRHDGAADGADWSVAHVDQFLQRVGGVDVALPSIGVLRLRCAN